MVKKFKDDDWGIEEDEHQAEFVSVNIQKHDDDWYEFMFKSCGAFNV